MNTRRLAQGAAGMATVTLLVTGCQFSGVNSLDMPGTAGHGAGSFVITVELPNVSSLPQNSPVKVDDVTVGSVSGVKAMQRNDGSFYAAVQLSLTRQVDLPANPVVRVAQTSLLGSQHIELAAPDTTPAVGRLTSGTTVPISQAANYPTTEDVLSSLGIVVSKGNLGALQDITDELYAAVVGRAGEFDGLIPRLAELAAAVDRQTGDIIASLEGLDRVATTLAAGNDKLARTLAALPEALRVLDDNAGNVVDAFAALKRLSEVTARVLAQTKTDLAADLKDTYPVVKAFADSADDIVDSLPYLPTYPLPGTYLDQAVRGDFLNAFVTIDLTLRRIGESLFTTSPLDPNMKHLNDVVNAPDFLTGAMANVSGQAADPFTVPSTSGAPG
ncbi:mammalian cell entry protein [Mycobacterium sp. Root265]|uniref:MCE family protein n=1 Tax=Mycobacterium sp. Root265 TaxID=1736504 RepID=UPI0007111F3B|nr:MCE family protein [Mycobacterium sp. Root265]KRD14401.1 mammalian cell entry protein [Mycobacterium sp. Root265]